MGRILRIDAAAGEAYPQKSFASALSEYFTFCVNFPAATLDDPAVQANWIDLCDIYTVGGGYLDGLFLAYDAGEWKWWWEFGPGSPVGTVAPDEWHTVEWRVDSVGQRVLRVNSIELAAFDSFQVGAAGRFAPGSYYAFGSYPAIWYYDDVKIGSSGYGSSNIFDDDFESGDLSSWTTVVGTASVVADDVTGGGCSGGGGVSVSASPTSLAAVEGGSDATTVTVSGVTESVDLSISGLPSGVHANFSVDPVSAPGSSTLTLTIDAGTTPGTYTLTITGTGSASSDTVTIHFAVISGANTTCETAATISGSEGTIVADNTDAHGWVAPDPLFSDPSWGIGYGGGGPLWWKYTNTRTRPVLLRVFIEPYGTIERVLVGIFRRTCGDMQAEECGTTWGNSGTWNGYTADLNVPADESLLDYVDAVAHPGETLYIEVDGYSGDTNQPPTLGPPNRGRFQLRYEVHSITVPLATAYDGIEQGITPENDRTGCGDTYSEPTSRIGDTDDPLGEYRLARADDYVELGADSWYTSAFLTEFLTEASDDFNRANANPLDGNWINSFLTSFGGSSAMKLVGNEATGTVSSLCVAGWATPLGADQEIQADITVSPGSGPTFTTRLFIRMAAAGSTGYMCRFDNSGTVISRVNGSSVTTLGSGSGAVAPSKIRLLAIGTTIIAQVLYPADISWTTLVAVVDGTYNRVGYVAMGIAGTTGRLDNVAVSDGTVPPSLPQARVYRWDGSSIQTYILPILGTWMQSEILLNTDGETLWATTTENGGGTLVNPKAGVGGPAHWSPAYPIIFAYDPGTDEFVRVGTMTPKAANIYAIGLEGPVGLNASSEGFGAVGGIDATAHPSMPGRLYVVWSEKGQRGLPIVTYADHPDEDWVEHVAISCFGPSAPFSEVDIGISHTTYGAAVENLYGDPPTIEPNFGSTAVGDVPYWTDDGRSLLVNDQGVCQLFRIEAQNPRQDTPNPRAYQQAHLRCEQVEDDGSLTLKRIIEWQPPTGSGYSVSDMTNAGQATHISIESECHGESGGGIPLQGDSWVFVAEGSDFPGNHPDYDFLIANGIAGVLWLDTDTHTAAGIASTQAAGLLAGVWLVAGNSETATDYANRASSAVATFGPSLLVMDNEFVAKGFDPSPGWTWNEDVMALYRSLQPTQATAVTMLPNQDDFNYAAYTSRSVGIWPQSYGANIPADDIPPMDVINRVIANGVDPAVVKAVLPYDPWSTDVETLRANGIYTFAVFTAEGMQAQPGGGTPPDPPSESPTTTLARTLIVGWSLSFHQGFAFAYNLDPLLEAPERWYNDNVQQNGADVLVPELGLVGSYSGQRYPDSVIAGGGGGRKTLHRDRFGGTWAFNGRQHRAIFFERKCNQAWVAAALPWEADTSLAWPVLQGEMTAGRQIVFDEPEDVVRSATAYFSTGGNFAPAHLYTLAVSHMKILRTWVICEAPGLIIGPESGLPFIAISFKTHEDAHAPGGTGDFGPLHLRAIFHTSKSNTSPAGPSNVSPVNFSAVRFQV